MTGKRSNKLFVSFFLVLTAVALLLLFLILGPPKLLAKTDEPDFCMKCHVMEPHYEAWLHSGAHKRKKCVDCHIPNNNEANHYLWKAIFGVKDVMYFYSGRIPELIRLNSRGGGILQSNCIRCHETTVMLTDNERRCWSCHRRIAHLHTGTIETY